MDKEKSILLTAALLAFSIAVDDNLTNEEKNQKIDELFDKTEKLRKTQKDMKHFD